MKARIFTIEATIAGRPVTIRSDGSQAGTTFTGDSDDIAGIQGALRHSVEAEMTPDGETVTADYTPVGLMAAIKFGNPSTVLFTNVPKVARKQLYPRSKDRYVRKLMRRPGFLR